MQIGVNNRVFVRNSTDERAAPSRNTQCKNLQKLTRKREVEMCVFFVVIKLCYSETNQVTQINMKHNNAFCRTKGPLPLPKRALQTVRSITSSFYLIYSLFSLSAWVFSLFLLFPSHLHLHLTRIRRQFLRKVWPVRFGYIPLANILRLVISLLKARNKSFPNESCSTYLYFVLIFLYTLILYIAVYSIYRRVLYPVLRGNGYI